MIVNYNSDSDAPLTAEQIKMIEDAKKVPITYDEDAPYFTKEELQYLRNLAEQRKQENKKEVVSLRLSAKTLDKAKSLGKGYTSILSRILEDVLSDNEKIAHYI